MKYKSKKIAREMAKASQQLDTAVMRESMEFVKFVRQLGGKRKDFSILPSSESRLRIIPSVYKHDI